MRKRTWFLSFSMLLLGLMLLSGCPKKAEVSSAPEAQPQRVEKAPAPSAADAAREAARAAEAERAREAAARKEAGLRPIYFDFDKSVIRDDAKSVLRADAEYLKAHPKAKIRIEGNCDERGTIEYNQALGQRRATSTRSYLADLGISGKRISLLSYGKEKPVCTQSSEECWQKNRRGDLIVVSE